MDAMKNSADSALAWRKLRGPALLGTLLTLTLGGCSSFDRDWEAAPQRPPAPPAALEGHWEGSWTSEANGHTGGLRCILTRKEGDTYEARYYATYSWCVFTFSFEYSVPMTAVQENGVWAFHGNAELSCWIGGGKYEYEGLATDSVYSAKYRSSDDHGVFKMGRVK
jgi:hypothetical protein